MQHLKRLYHTLKPLKWQQYWYRLYQPLRRKWYQPRSISKEQLTAAINWPQSSLFTVPPIDLYDPEDRSFQLLNITQQYPDRIDWNEQAHGLLWAYHLNYFGWLVDETIPVAERLQTMQAYAGGNLSIGLGSYPISLRGIAWVRFFAAHGIKEPPLYQLLYTHYHRLYTFPEHHLQGNHLWENGCSLFYAGHFFKYTLFYQRGKEILQRAFKEQVLQDGGHIEGSPMYHSLLLFRLLQCIEWAQVSIHFADAAFTEEMRTIAARMLGWMEQITFQNGTWPRMNDSTENRAPSTQTLLAYARQLRLAPVTKDLADSGFRMFKMGRWELAVNVRHMQPVYQPGHAHADMLSFCLNIDHQPVIVDPGISTYEPGERREWERSTAAHNTISIGGANSSDVWKSFRTGGKARLEGLEETKHALQATCKGFKEDVHSRAFHFFTDRIIINDILKCKNNKGGLLHLHFYPDMVLEKRSECEILARNLLIKFEGITHIEIEPYFYASDFNKLIPAQRLTIRVGPVIKTTIEILHAY